MTQRALVQTKTKWYFRKTLWYHHVNDLSDDLTTNVKLFADDTSLFSVVHNTNTSTILTKT